MAQRVQALSRTVFQMKGATYPWYNKLSRCLMPEKMLFALLLWSGRG